LGWLYDLDACRLAFWLKWEVHVVPRQTALSFIPRANVIRPACGEHEEHFITFGVWQFIELCFPAALISGIVL
jgi:hypothetical protein